MIPNDKKSGDFYNFYTLKNETHLPQTTNSICNGGHQHERKKQLLLFYLFGGLSDLHFRHSYFGK